MKKFLVIHPVFFAIYPLLAYFAHNFNEIEPGLVFLPLLVVVGFSLFFWLIVGFVFKNFKSSAVLVFLVLVFFFSYRHLLDTFLKMTKIGLGVEQERYFFLAWVMILIFLSWLVFKKFNDRQKIDNLNRFLNVMTVVLVLISLVRIADQYLQSRFVLKEVGLAQKQKIIPLRPEKEAGLPDIYYLVFDRYASAESLNNYYDYDNSHFINYLTQKGFFVADQSRANYPITDLSLASTLNMEYLDSLARQVGPESSDPWPIYGRFNNHRVGDFLKRKGYAYFNVGSTFWLTRKDKNADHNFLYPELGSRPAFFIKFLETTVLRPFLSLISIGETSVFEFLSWEYLSRETSLFQLKTLTEVANLPGPKFVFAHLLLPHEPFVFDQNGRYLTKKETQTGERRKLYLEQLIFTNQLIREMLDDLTLKTKGEAIIILQADEGPFPVRYKAYEYLFNWDFATADEIQEKFGILNAYFLPKADQSRLYSTITPVNTFRLIFNLYFETNLPLLPDKIYGIKDRKHPYHFTNLTNKF